MKELNVLSLFDGMSCGQIALERAGLEVGNYYASEIDKNAIKITKDNFPGTLHLGDVNLWESWGLLFDWSEIDLVLAGSPCQGFSFAGKQLAFDDPRSALFFKFLDVLNKIKEVNPNVAFLLENVNMKKESLQVITDLLGVEPLKIDSALLSAQSRKRYYWSNLPGPTIADKGIKLSDIIESGNVDREKSLCLVRRYVGFRGSQSYMRRRYFGKSMGQAVFEGSSPEYHKGLFKKDPYAEDIAENGFVRALTVTECERLQTVPEGYCRSVSETAAKEALGNGWTVDVIVEFLKQMNK
jgi:site-specific DNA-cytosine methylase